MGILPYQCSPPGDYRLYLIRYNGKSAVGRQGTDRQTTYIALSTEYLGRLSSAQYVMHPETAPNILTHVRERKEKRTMRD